MLYFYIKRVCDSRGVESAAVAVQLNAAEQNIEGVDFLEAMRGVEDWLACDGNVPHIKLKCLPNVIPFRDGPLDLLKEEVRLPCDKALDLLSWRLHIYDGIYRDIESAGERVRLALRALGGEA